MDNIQNQLPRLCKFLETVLAIVIFLGMLLYGYHLLFMEGIFMGLVTGEASFLEFLEVIFGLVIGIEFIEMLCRPDSQTVLEVLIFLLARHMIIETPSPAGLFISVIAVCVLCVVRRALHITKIKTLNLEDEFIEHEKVAHDKEVLEKQREKEQHAKEKLEHKQHHS